MDKAGLVRVLDDKAGPWPLDLAEGLVGLVLRCLSINNGPNKDLKMVTIMEELEEIRKNGDALVATGGYACINFCFCTFIYLFIGFFLRLCKKLT